jgi:mannose-6-phosphate isomerase-like protein (cupin superfamily)
MALITPQGLPWHEPPGHERGYSKYLLSPQDGLSSRLDLRLSRYPIGGRVLPHVHDVAEQAYFFISGRALVVCGEEAHIAGPQDTVFVPPGVNHSVENTGDGDLVFIVITTPPEDIPR